MAQSESFAHIELILNGHRFTGWADEDPPFEFDFEESSDRTRGADGGMYALGMPTYGGTFTFKMFPYVSDHAVGHTARATAKRQPPATVTLNATIPVRTSIL